MTGTSESREFPAEYEDGKFSGAPDTWISGLGKAEPGNLMLADPQLGTPEYLQGWSPDIDFLDCAKVYKVQQKTCVPVGCYENVLITDERSPLEPDSGHQRKYYAQGGALSGLAVDDPEGETPRAGQGFQVEPTGLGEGQSGSAGAGAERLQSQQAVSPNSTCRSDAWRDRVDAAPGRPVAQPLRRLRRLAVASVIAV